MITKYKRSVNSLAKLIVLRNTALYGNDDGQDDDDNGYNDNEQDDDYEVTILWLGTSSWW